MSKANFVRIVHEDGSMAVYLHLLTNSVRVSVGQHVVARQILALSGNTGYSSGPHLHFAVSVNTTNGIRSVPLVFQNGNPVQDIVFSSSGEGGVVNLSGHYRVQPESPSGQEPAAAVASMRPVARVVYPSRIERNESLEEAGDPDHGDASTLPPDHRLLAKIELKRLLQPAVQASRWLSSAFELLVSSIRYPDRALTQLTQAQTPALLLIVRALLMITIVLLSKMAAYAIKERWWTGAACDGLVLVACACLLKWFLDQDILAGRNMDTYLHEVDRYLELSPGITIFAFLSLLIFLRRAVCWRPGTKQFALGESNWYDPKQYPERREPGTKGES